MNKLILLVIIALTISLNSQNFDIKKFSDPEKYGWENYAEMQTFRNELQRQQQLLPTYNKQKKSANFNAFKAAVLPGWGHFSSERYTKGNIILGIEIILLGTSYIYYDKAMDQYDKYKNSNYIGNIDYYYEEANGPYKTAQAFLGLAVGVWIYNIYDAILKTNEYNTEIWQEIINDRVTITPNGISVRF